MAQKIKLIVGLGNLGANYEGTRHNIGFICLDFFASEQGLGWKEKTRFQGVITEYTHGDERIVLLKPSTYMNNSGQAVQSVSQFYKLTNDQILVIHDELDLPFGTVRTRIGGSHAGNNGIRSISSAVGDDYVRVRCGIANEHRQNQPAEVFVLERFSKEEAKQLDDIKKQVALYIDQFVSETLQAETIRL